MVRRLAAILCADVAGYSRMMEADEQGTHDALKDRRKKYIEPLLEQYHGRIVKLTGDGALVEFASAVDAVSCARGIQDLMAKLNAELPEELRIWFRIGINIGDIIIEEEDIYGTGVNVAARLQELAEPGGIYASKSVADSSRSLSELSFEPLGRRSMKNIAEPVEIYRVGWSGEKAVPAAKVLGRRTGKTTVAALGIVCLVALAAVGWFVWPTQPVRPPLPTVPSVAVLPFDNLSSDSGQDHLAKGISEDLITNLSKDPDFFVIARNSSFMFSEKPVDIKRVGRELGIRYVVEGSVRRSSNAIRVTAQLIDAVSGRHIWAERYDRPLEEIFDIQDSVTASIAATMMGSTGVIAQAETQRLKAKSPNSFTAYDYLMRGWAAWYRFTREDNEMARSLFQKAIEVDPGYARGYAGLAWTYAMDYQYDWTEDYKGAVEKVTALAHKAIELDDRDYRNYWALGWANLYQWDHERAIANYTKARNLNPNDAELMVEMASLLIYIGKPEEAIEQAKEAMRRNPLHEDWYYEYLGWAYEEAGRPEECITAFNRVLGPEPTVDQLWILRTLAACYASAEVNRMDEAQRLASKILELDPEFTMTKHQAYIEEVIPYANQGLIDRWITALARVGLPE